MGAKDHALRFGVGSTEGPHSMVWRVWVASDEVYVAPRVFADVAKVSLHSSGRWRSGFSEDHIQRSGMYMSPRADRAILKWHRPPETAPGWIKAVVILAATSDLRTESEQHGYGKVIWIAAPSNDLDTRFTVLLASPEVPENEVPPHPWSTAQHVGQVHLRSGGRVWVVAEQMKLDANEQSELEAVRAIHAEPLFEDDGQEPAYPFSVSTALDDNEDVALLLSVATFS